MEKDIKRIKLLSKKKENENWEFRSFLKWHSSSSRKLDQLVHKVNEEVSSKIDCRACANCCIEIKPILQKKDIDRISNHLDITSDNFTEKYLYKDEDGDFLFKSSPCPFLKNKLCSIYKYRPHDCRSFPHLYKKNFTSRLIGVVQNCSVCPIVYNVYEKLKNVLS